MAYGLRTVGGALAGAGKAVALGAGGAAAMGARQLASAVPGGAAAVTAGIGGLSMIGAGAMKGYQYAGGGKGSGGKGSGGSGAGGVDDSFKSIIDTNEKLIAGQKSMFKILVKIRLDTNRIRKCVEDMKALAYEDARGKLKEIKKPSKIIPTIMAGAAGIGAAGMGLGKIVAAALAALSAFVAELITKIKQSKAWRAIAKFFSAEGWIAVKFRALVALIRNAAIWTTIKTFFSAEGWIARTFKAMKLAISESTWMKNIKIFFSAEGWIPRTFKAMKDSIKTSTWMASLTTFFSAEGWIPRTFKTMKDSIKTSTWMTSLTTFFSSEGMIPRAFKAMKDSIKTSTWMASLTTFFSAEGMIPRAFKAMKLAISESTWIKNIQTFMSAEGMIPKAFQEMKLAMSESTWIKNIQTFFSAEGMIPKAFKTMKDAVTTSTWMTSITHFFSAEGAIASRIAKITAVLRGVGGGAAAGAGKAGAMGIQVAKGIGSGIKAAFTTAKTIISGFFSSVSKVFKHIKTIGAGVKTLLAGPLKVIAAIVKPIAGLLGRIFAPILLLWTWYEAIKGFLEGWKKEGVEEDADLYTKFMSGFWGAISGILKFIVGMPADFLLGFIAWAADKLGFSETSKVVKDWLGEGGVSGIIEDVFAWVSSIPIAAWKFIKGLLGFGEAKSEAGKAGASFIDNFKEKLAAMWGKFGDIIPDLSDIPALAKSILAKIQIWFGEKISGIGTWMNTKLLLRKTGIGDKFIEWGKDMQKGGVATQTQLRADADAKAATATDIIPDTRGQMAAAFVGATVANRGGRDAAGTVNVGSIDQSQKIIAAPTGVDTGMFGRIDVGAATRKSDLHGGHHDSFCWVARKVYGEDNPDWKVYRKWMLTEAPSWFLSLYIRYGEKFAKWLDGKNKLQSIIRKWMDKKVHYMKNNDGRD